MRRTKSIPKTSEYRSCNHGDIRICGICQYNDDCPYVRTESYEQ